MLLYKKIDIDGFEIIQKQIYDLFVEEFNGAKEEVLFRFETEEFLNKIPLLADFFNKHNLNPITFAAFIRTPGVAAPIHVDGDNSDTIRWLAINLPIANCKNTFMNWYDIPLGDLDYINDRGNKYRAMPLDFDYRSLTPLDRVELDSPYILRIDVPHNVTNDRDTYRMVLSIRFDPQPAHLWPEAMDLWK
jgi:hypothetical protein